MTRTAPYVVVAAVLIAFTACQRDPGRDVERMPNLLENTATPAVALENLPLEEVRASQAAAVSQRIANTEITLTYSRLVARGRELFGVLIPYGEIWNPGADQAIFNRAAEVYHEPYPGADQDALRLDVRPETGFHMEVMAFYFHLVEGKETTLHLHWGETIVPQSIRVP